MRLAVEWGDRSIIKALLFAGKGLDSECVSPNEDSLLALAVRKDDQDLVQFLLESGAPINGTKGITALAAAAECDNVNMVRYLLMRGADPHNSLALEKCMPSNRKMLEILLDEHVKRYPLGLKGYGSDALRQAVELGQEDLVRVMLEKGADATKTTLSFDDSLSSFGYQTSAFGQAIMKDHPKRTQLIEIFLRARCDPNGIVSESIFRFCCDTPSGTVQTTPSKITALLAAISTKDVSIVKLLIKEGAKANFPAGGPVQRSPLQRAAEIGSLGIVELLIEHGAEVNGLPARNGGGTALQLAAIGGYIAIACQLIAKGANVNAKASIYNGRTALEGASEHGRLDMVAVLLKAGAAENGKDHQQLKRAIEFARENGHFHVCEFIEDVAGQALVEESELVDWDGQAAMMAET